MTGKSLRKNIIITTLALFIASVGALAIGAYCRDLADQTKAVIPVFIAIAAGWLTSCFQRRTSYTNTLRSFWDKTVDTVHDALQYASAQEKSEGEYRRLLHKLSCRIDESRGIFRNVGEWYVKPSEPSKKLVAAIRRAKTFADLSNSIKGYAAERDHIGVFPLESLKQIHHIIVMLGHGDAADPEKSKVAREAISVLWKIMRAELLKELDRDYAEFPDTPYEGRHSLESRPSVSPIAPGTAPTDRFHGTRAEHGPSEESV